MHESCKIQKSDLLFFLNTAVSSIMNQVFRKTKRNPGRGSSTVPLDRITGSPLCTRETLVCSATSEASKENAKRARKLHTQFAHVRKAGDPVTASANTSLLVLNLIAKYCNFGTP